MDKTQVFAVNLTPDQHDWLRRQSFETREPMTAIVRRLIDDARTNGVSYDTGAPGGPTTQGFEANLTLEQYEWLRRESFETRQPMTVIVRRLIDDARRDGEKDGEGRA
jgi:hypothetical protein